MGLLSIKNKAPVAPDPNRSCWMCGYFGKRSPEARERDGYSGRCHNMLDVDYPEFLPVIHGSEKESAQKCKSYFRRSEHLDLPGFLNWRSSMVLDLNRQVGERQFRIIVLIVSGAALIDFVCKALGVWR